ncbi:MAG: DNA translocase FtsK, partial [Spirochaetales bacterium]|nr:DNA translocase FtsK [Spirochaetales bacterium]
LSFFIFLFPYRYLLAGFVVNMFGGEPHSDTTVKQTRPTHSPKNSGVYNEYRIPNRETKTQTAERPAKNVKSKSKKDTPPWMTKVTIDKGNGWRIETPMFSRNDEKPTKFIYKGEEEDYHIYEQAKDELSEMSILPVGAKETETPKKTSAKNSETQKISVQNNDDSDYYRKLKEQWPEAWKNPQAKSESSVPQLPDMQGENIPAVADNDDDIVILQNEKAETKAEPQPLNEEEIQSMINNISMPHIEDAEFVEDETDIQETDTQNDDYNDSILLNDDDDIEFSGEYDADESDNDAQEEKSVSAPKNTFTGTDYLPDTDLLQTVEKVNPRIFEAEEQEAAQILEATLLEFKIKATVTDIIHGPVVTLFKVNPAAGVKLTAIENLSNNLAMRLSAKSIRIIAPIPGESVVGIEIPNRKRETVSFKEIINSNEFINTKYNIPIGIGKDIYGRIITLDMYKMPHMLIAGATGSGKSVCVNSFICSILFSRSPDEVRMIMIDPKIVELKPYNDIPHLLAPVITDPRKAITALKYLVYEMERRYELLGNMGVRDITEYRAALKSGKARMENLPFIVAFVDEFADLM